MKKPSTPTTSLNPPVFYTSVALTLALVGFAVLAPQLAQAAFDHVQGWISANPSWFGVLAVAVMVFFVALVVADKRELAHQSLPGSGAAGRNSAWQQHLQHLVHFPRRDAVTCYIDNVITPACNAVATQMVARNVDAKVQRADEDRVRLSARHGEEQAFSYEVRLRSVALPVFAGDSAHEEQSSKYYSAEVFLQEGGQGYCVMNWSHDDVVADILHQYERHLQFQNVER